MMGGKVIWRDIVFPVLYGCRGVLSLDRPWCYKAASKHLSHIGEGRSASSVVHSIIPVAGKVLAETLQLSDPSPGLALHRHTSPPMHTLLH